MRFTYAALTLTGVSLVLGDSGALGAYGGDASSSNKAASVTSSVQSHKLVQTSNVEQNTWASSDIGDSTDATATDATASSAATAAATATTTTTGGPITVVTSQNSAGETYLSTVWWTPSVTKWWTPESEIASSTASDSSTGSSSASHVTTATSSGSKSAKSSSTASVSSLNTQNSTNAADRPQAGVFLGLGAMALGAMAL
ncbi:LADA_0E14532g1_1 [Lachancea dasiensis]|uniref:LADA_0E14532g1_1 n=1 Tax=Lachancea dasiensis TaxID=1072105 RepID=A0A1G4JG33_9SACH|nr:LADA_0E14532g1_1 [Lachancea dasiensis]